MRSERVTGGLRCVTQEHFQKASRALLLTAALNSCLPLRAGQRVPVIGSRCVCMFVCVRMNLPVLLCVRAPTNLLVLLCLCFCLCVCVCVFAFARTPVYACVRGIVCAEEGGGVWVSLDPLDAYGFFHSLVQMFLTPDDESHALIFGNSRSLVGTGAFPRRFHLVPASAVTRRDR